MLGIEQRSRWRWALGLMMFLLLGGLTAYAVIWYEHFYHHVTAQELSHAVSHSTVQVRIRGGSTLTLQLYQQANVTDQPLVIFTSGDGGWSPFCADIAAHLAATGKTVLGFNAKDYLVDFGGSQKPVSVDELERDYEALIKGGLSQNGVDNNARVVLAGWSLGAGFSVLAATDPAIKTHLDRVVAISLPIYNELAWKPTDALIYITHGTPREKVFDAHEFLKKLDSIPVVLLNATDDDTSPFTEARSLFDSATGPKRFYAVQASGHHFEGGEKEFYRDLDEGLQLNHQNLASPVSTEQ